MLLNETQDYRKFLSEIR